jgi:hypothetical protein
MTKKRHLIYSLGITITGLILNGLAWTVAGPHPYNTIFLVTGLFGFLVGAIWLIITLIR